ncbi:hypothetical protein FH972_023399 [Carpinus fangiana]|uniref:Aminotransferase class I/classII large domain-containing protein n=1 Tax=Carpinus fangiana TaxID=176857 RepID=A0A5N6KV32_9ROSI|nr:hypothetical protein FH972_023399 [Carpinus fangiana]
MSSTPRLRSLNIDNINPHVKTAKYAVRGELAVRAEKYRQALTSDKPATPDSDNEGRSKLPFESVISANIGNPQQLDQKPITFFRQVTSLLENPLLLEKPQILIDHLGYHQDVIDRAQWLLSELNSVGAYSVSQGVPGVRDSVARFIEKRDGHPADPASIYLTAGASAGVNTLLHVICAGPQTGVLVPIPQYPLYTATLALLNARCVPYELDESKGWGTDLETIKASLKKGRDDGADVRAMVVINPGNPTGASLTSEEIESVIAFAADEKLVLLADEVYQTNIFEGTFTSFKKALRDLQQKDGERYKNVELASLHSVSKGMVGECGQRGGYMELIGFDPQVVEQIYKFVSIGLCPPVIGQCIVECMVNPPAEGSPSYPLYRKEYDTIFNGLRDRADALYKAFQDMEGVKCQKPTGSMYLFPTIELPEKATQAAKDEGKGVDEFYVSKMLDATGVCMVPGSGFGQKENTFHFRTTFLPPGTDWVDRLRKFHGEFVQEFR